MLDSTATQHNCSLLPFAPGSAPSVALSAGIVRRPRLLQAEFRLAGTLAAIVIPLRAAQPQRRHELWQATCFELFFAAAGSEAYHEVNLSPAGHWNLYRFAAYRKDMREELTDCLECRILSSPDSLVVRLEIDLSPLDLEDKTLAAGPSAVLLSQDTTLSYWATTHPTPRPDFHDQRAWLSLPESLSD